MSDEVELVAVGRPAARAARWLSGRSQEILVLVLATAPDGGPDRDRIEAGVARHVLRGFARSRGSLTARLRDGMLEADRWLERRCGAEVAGREPPAAATAGASALAVTADEAVLAQVGPALAYGPDGAAVPAGAATAGAGADRWARPLGTGGEVLVRWAHWPACPGCGVLLATPAARPVLHSALPPALGAMAADGGREALAAALGRDDAALWVRWPHDHGRPEEPAPEHAFPPRAADGPRLTPGPPGPAAAGAGAWPTSLATGRRLARRTGRAAVALLRATLPEPRPAHAARAGTDHAVWTAVAALLLPAVLLAFSLVQRSRHAPPPPPASAGTSSLQAPVDLAAAPDGPRALEGLQSVAVLPGDPDRQRRVVVAAGQTYVLDTGRNVVERLTGGTWQTVLRRGTAVDGRVAGNLLHLFWLPSPPEAAGGRATALDAAGQLWALDGGTVAPVARAPRPAWRRVERAAGFRGDLFAVEMADDQVWHHQPDAAPFPSFTAAGRAWLETPVDMADSAAIGIDGAVYLLWADGRMAKFAAGREQAFAARSAAPPPFEASALYTSATAGRLLVADRGNGQVLVLTPAGELVERLARPAQPAAAEARHRSGHIDRLHDVWWDEAARALYLLSGSALLRAPYGP